MKQKFINSNLSYFEIENLLVLLKDIEKYHKIKRFYDYQNQDFKFNI